MSEADPTSVSPRTPGRRPSTSTAEIIDVLEAQRPALIAVAVVVSLIGAIVAVVAPTVLPPRPLAGAAVGFAACALAVATAVALDAADRVVRGPRHVRGAGAVHVATVGPLGIAPLVTWAEHRLRTEGSIRLALAGAGVDVLRSGRVTDELAKNLARKGWRVLRVDLHDPNGSDGVAEVIQGDKRLSEVVDYHPTLDLAEVGPGHDLDVALRGFPDLASRLPRDVDALLVAMPGVRQPDVLPAIAAIDGILVLAQAGSTTRVELIAALDALDEVQVVSEVVLLEEDAQLGASSVEPAAVGTPPRVEEQPAFEPAAEVPAEDVAPPGAEPVAAEEVLAELRADEPAPEEPAPEEPAPEEPASEEPASEPGVGDDTAELPPIPATDLEPGSEQPEPEDGAPPEQPEPEDGDPEPPPPAPPEPPAPPHPGPPREVPRDARRPDPLDRTPYAADAWKTGTRGTHEPGQQAGAEEPEDRAVGPDDDREEALRLTATLEHLANEIWARENGSDDEG